MRELTCAHAPLSLTRLRAFFLKTCCSGRVSEKKSEKKDTASKSPARTSSKQAAGAAGTAASVAKREAELDAARAELGLFKTPLKVCTLFATATAEFLASNVLAFATSQLAYALVYPLIAAWLLTRKLFPEWYQSPDCLGRSAGFLYAPSLAVHESLWWLILGILSSIGLGTGLHSGLMFLWPFVMAVILNVESCKSASFSATYNHPCALGCDASTSSDGTDTFFNTFMLLFPSIVLWGSGTAIGELVSSSLPALL